jgi:hypothetical protein
MMELAIKPTDALVAYGPGSQAQLIDLLQKVN